MSAGQEVVPIDGAEQTAPQRVRHLAREPVEGDLHPARDLVVAPAHDAGIAGGVGAIAGPVDRFEDLDRRPRARAVNTSVSARASGNRGLRRHS